jgi:uncharacterized RDD family membrane protein YckC
MTGTALTNDEYAIVQGEIAKLEKANQELVDDSKVKDKVSEFSKTDSAFIVLVYKICLVLYSIIYLVLLYTLYVYKDAIGIPTMIIIAVMFAMLPFFIDGIAAYAYGILMKLIHLVYKGNSMFLYKPKLDDL